MISMMVDLSYFKILLLLCGDVETNPGPVTRVSERDVSQLVEKLAIYASKWRDIGSQLGFIGAELDTIGTPYGQNAKAYLTAMLNEWVHWTPATSHGKYATLEDLKTALRSDTVNLGDVADRLDLSGSETQRSSGVGLVSGSETGSSSGRKLGDEAAGAVLTCLRRMTDDQIKQLGIQLGLYIHTVEQMRSVPLARDMVAAWLNMQDSVKETSGNPTWGALVKALQAIGQTGIADKIKEEKL